MVVGAVYLYNFRKAYLVNDFFVQSVHIACTRVPVTC
jgi:hypothetical protein